ncbi:calcium-binding protein [Methylobacterium nigriterrae]|uniref:calcium-binding protein n=1 Tax=Methylobacterium nigriterrae TaxID=3127512 RepID=UPI0030134057
MINWVGSEAADFKSFDEYGLSNDFAKAGGGNDIVYGGAGSDQLFGGDGEDKLYGGIGVDVIHGDAGHDKIYGGAGADQLFGGEGADDFYIHSTDTGDYFFGQADQINDFNSDDTIWLQGNFSYGGSGNAPNPGEYTVSAQDGGWLLTYKNLGEASNVFHDVHVMGDNPLEHISFF